VTTWIATVGGVLGLVAVIAAASYLIGCACAAAQLRGDQHRRHAVLDKRRLPR
jgi:hypothetical protein